MKGTDQLLQTALHGRLHLLDYSSSAQLDCGDVRFDGSNGANGQQRLWVVLGDVQSVARGQQGLYRVT